MMLRGTWWTVREWERAGFSVLDDIREQTPYCSPSPRTKKPKPPKPSIFLVIALLAEKHRAKLREQRWDREWERGLLKDDKEYAPQQANRFAIHQAERPRGPVRTARGVRWM